MKHRLTHIYAIKIPFQAPRSDQIIELPLITRKKLYKIYLQ